VRLARFETARPQQMDLIERIAGELRALVVGQVLGETFRVPTQQRLEHLALRVAHRRRCEALRRTRPGQCGDVVGGEARRLVSGSLNPDRQLVVLAVETAAPDVA
jgi:hypothetical protein